MYQFMINKLISETVDFRITIAASNGQDLIDKIERSTSLPHLCILDIGMPLMDGYKTIDVIKHKWPTIKVLIFSYYHPYAIGIMLQSGAWGFISKAEKPSVLIDAIINIKETGYYYTEYITKEMFRQAAQKRLPLFTPVEKQILSLISGGLQYDEIAQAIGI